MNDRTSQLEHDEASAIRCTERISAEFHGLSARPLEPALYLIATPIGNLSDITLRALSVLVRADKIYCEDTRHSRKLTNHYGITARLIAYHDHSTDSVRDRILTELKAGSSVALISDAGTPLISDPGFKLSQLAIEHGLKVISLPGPTAPIVALTSSGLPTDNFQFLGFLPNKSGARRERISTIKNADCVSVFFEAPTRLSAALGDLHDILGNRQAVVARELTKIHEEFKRGQLSDLKAWADEGQIKGEIVILISPDAEPEINDDDILRALNRAMNPMSLKDAARDVADELGVAKKRVYELGLSGLNKK